MAKADMLQLSGMGYLILRMPRDRHEGKKGKKGYHTVQWPAWQTIAHISQIRGMSMEAVVHADPDRQRRKSFCPTPGK